MEYLWILSRTKEMDKETYSMLLDFASRSGFDVSRLFKVSQECD